MDKEIGRIEAVKGADGPEVASQPETSPSRMPAATKVVDTIGKDRNWNRSEWRSWRNERDSILDALASLEARQARTEEAVRALRAIVQGKAEATDRERQRALWVRARLAGRGPGEAA